MMKTTDRILDLLKRQGAQTAKELAAELDMTTMGVRQHLQALEQESLVSIEDRAEGRGRPSRYWMLTADSQSRFPDRHEELSVQLIESVRVLFGDAGLDKLISHREQAALARYQAALAPAEGLAQRLDILARLRSDEGYMAAVLEQDGHYYLVENHCPICAAAATCQNFCRNELQLFQRLLGDEVRVSREEHILAGARRCAYRIEAEHR
ncbi:helix-turn-helix transcriptional regulator [Zobellella sp. DQSA1]|uniref:helix-turn-helix transcriptional regulator n=1 Tax=Zobellella sp. DQSA1 TaxID=3342386 RepID=UPI0035C018FF